MIASAQRGPYDRAWSMHLLDQQQEVAAVLTRALAEVETRRDVYGYDLAAWALYRAGRISEARTMMAKALRFQTPDPMLRRHAALIASAPLVVFASR
ncbi:hypothetical protein [Gemmatimonas sp.]|uniref:hypothetical protein n=1 Tax=Gemmatimonas sp. TaxID=1962908 RepID=UPI003562B29D